MVLIGEEVESLSVQPQKSDSPQLSSMTDRLGTRLSKRIPPAMPKQYLCFPLTIGSDSANKEATGQDKGRELGAEAAGPTQRRTLASFPASQSSQNSRHKRDKKGGKKDVLFLPVFLLFRHMAWRMPERVPTVCTVLGNEGRGACPKEPTV